MPALSCAPAAVRMRLYRKRRRRGMRLVRTQLDVTDIEALIHKGYLDRASRDDRDALEFAVNSFVDDALAAEA
jgi:hypothetical protein